MLRGDCADVVRDVVRDVRSSEALFLRHSEPVVTMSTDSGGQSILFTESPPTTPMPIAHSTASAMIEPLAMTLRYAHLAPDQKREAVEKLIQL